MDNKEISTASKLSKEQVSLLKIIYELELLDQEIANAKGEISEKTEEAMNLWLSKLEDKIDSCYHYRLEQKERADMNNNIADVYLNSAKTIKNRLERFDEYLKLCLSRSGKDVIKGPLSELKLRKATKKLKITSEKDIPLDFITREEIIKFDNKAITQALKNNESIPGAELIDGKQSIIFKTT